MVCERVFLMNWMILGIEPTKDKKVITDAYRAQLVHTNPEDKPEEFKALRAAYEEALRLADQSELTLVEEETPISIWEKHINNLYNDFSKRIQPENWQELLSDDACTALDTRPLAEAALLKFLMQNYYIPQSVWQVLDNAFLWVERKNELYESYPRDFVDYAIIDGVNYPQNLPYELFEPGKSAKDCDEYRQLYYKANQSALSEIALLIEQLHKLSEKHPYGELLTYLLMLENGETECALEGYHKLADSYPNDAKLQLEWATQCMNMEHWSESEYYIRRALEVRPADSYAKQMLAICLANQGNYDEAKKNIFKLMDDAGGDQKRILELSDIVKNWNEVIIKDLESQVAAAPENMNLQSQLAWCYLQNGRSDDAMVICQNLDPNYDDQYDYHNLYAKVAYSLGKYDISLLHLQNAESILQTMPMDGTEETASRLATMPEKLQMQGSCLMNMNRTEEAIQKYEQALELAPENPEVLTHMGRILCSISDFTRAADVFEKLTNVLPNSYHGFFLLSQTLFELGRDRDAFEAINRALNLDRSDLGVYILKMRILIRNGVWDDVRNIVEFLHQNGITDEINALWCEAQLLEFGEQQKAKALELYHSIATRVENGEYLEEACRLYFRILVLEAEHLDANKGEDRAKMLEMVEKGLSHNENDPPCLDYKAWLLNRDGQREEALVIYHRLEALPRRSMDVELELARIYYNDLNHDADKALHYYKILIDYDEQPEYLFYAGTCCRYLSNYEESEKYFLRLQEIYPDSVDGYNGMSYLYDTMKRYEESLEQINHVIERVESWEGNQSSYYYHKIRILCRLNLPIDAMSVLDEVSNKYGNDNIYREKFDICCQFGLWEKAEQILKDWRKSGSKKNQLSAATIDLKLFTGKIDEARTALKSVSKKLSGGDLERLNLLMGELDGDELTQMTILEKKAENRQDKTHELMNMAQVQWWNGHYDKAREYAQEALDQLDILIPCKKSYEALYRGRRSIILAILGRFEEAIEELNVVRNLPLCETCNYCSCKDADIFEANMEEIHGNWAKALELHSRGAEKWPDDMDFIAGARRMMRKGL